MPSVFDVAGALLSRAPREGLEALKLQKLCFYAFGWYAHLTGEPLFGEKFYAMKLGPVVGELLSAHAGMRFVKSEMIATQQEARDDSVDDLDAYVSALLDAVWSAYGCKSSGQLVQQTHQEAVWAEPWEARRAGTKRADIADSALIAYFMDRQPRKSEQLALPPAMLSRAMTSDLETAETAPVDQEFVDLVRAFKLVS